MRFRIAVALLLALCLSGCMHTRSRYPSGIKVQPVRIIDDDDEKATALIERIKKQDEAIALEPPPEPAAEKEPSPDASVETVAIPKPPKEKDISLASVDVELSVPHLLSVLRAKKHKTKAEQETHRRLLGIVPKTKRLSSEGSEVWDRLSAAQTAVSRGDYEVAQSHALAALALINRETNPSIDRFFFATTVRSYGNADIIEKPVFSRGQLVMAVADVSSFVMVPVNTTDGKKLFVARMTHRLSIHNSKRGMLWQKTYGPFEYQTEGRISTMFVQRPFTLPRKLKRGKYTLKTELIDNIAGRQQQAMISFTIR